MHQFDVSKSVFTVTNPMNTPQSIGLSQIPLNLLAFIVSYIENVGDLARLCRTSRLLHYMAQPQLYKQITLTSYDSIRYRDEIPEGYGSASPFSMGLNALVTRNIVGLVQSLTLQGEWHEHDLEEYSRAGRVPDSSMMLNIAVRAAVDRCINLASFSWKLNIRLMPTVYSGLGTLNHLASFHLRCPSKKIPQPATIIPPLSNLREFTMTDYDPLCHPDDLSTMFLSATKLESMILHFSPRMRSNAEPSVCLANIFRRNIASNKPIKLKRMALYNSFAMAVPELREIFPREHLEDITMINSFGPGNETGSSIATHFVDQTWRHEHLPSHDHPVMKSIRSDRLTDLANNISTLTGLEKLYLINANRKKAYEGFPPTISDDEDSSTPNSPPSEFRYSNPLHSNSIPSPLSTTSADIQRDNLIEVICKHHGATLKHLILPGKLPLSHFAVSQLIRYCPNLTQLCYAPEETNPEVLKHVLPFATKLRAVRLTAPEEIPGDVESQKRRKAFFEFEARPGHTQNLNRDAAMVLSTGINMAQFRYLGFGYKIWEVSRLQERTQIVQGEFGNDVEQVVAERKVRRICWDDVADVEIWKYDTTDMV